MKFGKFNSVEELQKAYAQLEKAFTKKCQQLSELTAKAQKAATKLSDKSAANAEQLCVPAVGVADVNGKAANVNMVDGASVVDKQSGASNAAINASNAASEQTEHTNEQPDCATADTANDDTDDLPWWMDDNHPVDGVPVNPSVAAEQNSDPSVDDDCKSGGVAACSVADETNAVCVDNQNAASTNVAEQANRASVGQIANQDGGGEPQKKTESAVSENQFESSAKSANQTNVAVQLNQTKSAAKNENQGGVLEKTSLVESSANGVSKGNVGEIQGTNIQNSYKNDIAQANTVAKSGSTTESVNGGVKTDGTSEASPPFVEDTASREATAVAVPDEKSNGEVTSNATMQAAIKQFIEQNPQFIAELLAKSSPCAPVVMTGGGSFQLVAPNRPKTIKEASALAKKLFE